MQLSATEKCNYQQNMKNFVNYLDYGLFTLSEDCNLMWFSAFCLESIVMFHLVGILLGLAIYNGIILDVHFPLLVYKKLLGYKVGLEDLREIQPTICRSLDELLTYEGDVERDFGLTFEVELFSRVFTSFFRLVKRYFSLTFVK